MHRALSSAPRLVRPLAVAALALASACADPLTGPASPAEPDAALAKKPVPPPPPPPPPTPATVHTPVLFVHGWNSSASAWTTMVDRFRQDGWTSAELATFSYNTSASNATTAAIIATKVDSIRAATGASRVEIVTHSMGTLSARYYVRSLGGDGKVDAIVSLGGANHGTSTSYLCVQTACREMYPGSTFLNALNATDETWGTPRYATWWSPCDEVINPRSSTPLAGATNTQTACLTHSALHEDATVYAQVRDYVNQPSAFLAAIGVI